MLIPEPGKFNYLFFLMIYDHLSFLKCHFCFSILIPLGTYLSHPGGGGSSFPQNHNLDRWYNASIFTISMSMSSMKFVPALGYGITMGFHKLAVS